jgi:hypothetical protein
MRTATTIESTTVSANPRWRSVIGPSTATLSPANVPTAATWTSHQMFHALSDRTGNTLFW